MKIVTSVKEMLNLSRTLAAGGRTIGLVPTMGALHCGHLSLLSVAREQADISVMSIFVNPTQFGPKEDFAKYPRPFEADCCMAESEGCDIVFAPEASDMYPEGYRTTVAVSDITERLCGASRPTHFAGVTTVVFKFFSIVKPDIAVFGAKDAQQVAVIRRMVTDLHLPVSIVVAPIIREVDGLALSSRNVYLTRDERKAATVLHRGLRMVEELYAQGERNAAKLGDVIRGEYAQEPLVHPEYIEVVDRQTLLPLDTITSSALVAVACRMSESGTRLIDNTVLGDKP